MHHRNPPGLQANRGAGIQHSASHQRPGSSSLMDAEYAERLLKELKVTKERVIQRVKDRTQKCVKKLFHARHGYLGSVTYVEPYLGICPFHCVVVGGQMMDSKDLRVEGQALTHAASFPYYDLSFFYINSETPRPYLDFGEAHNLSEGVELIVAGFPALSEKSYRVAEEEILLTPGTVVRIPKRTDDDFAVQGDYACSSGSSGAAIVDFEGKLLGLHLDIEYAENTDYYTPSKGGFLFQEPVVLIGPQVILRAPWIDQQVLFAQAKVKDLAKYAASNVGEKYGFGCFLPVNIIWEKMNYLLERANKDK